MVIKNTRVRWITQTGVFLALLIVLQTITAQFGNQFITGSVVNLILILSTMMCGFASGAAVACVAPIIIRLIGVGPPFWPLVPFIIIGCLVLVAAWHLIGQRGDNVKIFYPIALVVAAFCKFAVLYLGVVKFAAPILLNLPPDSPIMLAYSFPQIITACIGGVIAILILPVLKKATKYEN
jgi:hypothetical protein